jgi:hypothetical protein
VVTTPGPLQQAGAGVPVRGLRHLPPAAPGQSIWRSWWPVSKGVPGIGGNPGLSPPNCHLSCRVKFSAACGPPVTSECEHCGQRHQVGQGHEREGGSGLPQAT